jgi:hypothetical protein
MNTSGASGPRRRSRLVAAAIGCLLIVGGVLAAVAWPATGGSFTASRPSHQTAAPGPTPISIPQPTPVPGSLTSAAESAQAAESAVTRLIALNNAVLRAPTTSSAELSSFATGFVRGEVEALVLERGQLGYTQVGSAKITGITVLSTDLSADPPTVTLGVCIDSHGVDVMDAAGHSVAGQLYRPDGGVLNQYGAIYVDQVWKISTHTIPVNSDCTR